MDESKRWGWEGTWESFLATPDNVVLEKLTRRHEELFTGSRRDPSAGQMRAWAESVPLVRATVAELVERHPQLLEALVVLEYEIPGEPGNRADFILVLPTGHLLVLEFKGYEAAAMSDLDQVGGYAQDLREYHSETREMDVKAMLVLVKAQQDPVAPPTHQHIQLARPSLGRIPKLTQWADQAVGAPKCPVEPINWLKGRYEPLPHLLRGAAMAFGRQPLPRIKSVENTQIPGIMDWLGRVAEHARRNQRHYLILVTGAPGSGKTMIGLQAVAQLTQQGFPSLYLSGNGPLVAVLRDYLDRNGVPGKPLIKSMPAFHHDARETAGPYHAKVLVFDEGQRAHVEVKNYSGTEIQMLVEVASRSPWGVVIGLIGEGQEIYRNEDGTVARWLQDFASSHHHGAQWGVYVPDDQLVDGGRIRHRPELHLTTGLRTKRVSTLHEWVKGLLEGWSPENMKPLTESLYAQDYPIYYTQSRAEAEAYTRRFAGIPSKTFGWLASSNCDSDDLPQLPAVTRETLPQYVDWFNDNQCRRLLNACSQFGCQGLEIDFGLVLWGRDLCWTSNAWELGPKVRRNFEKPHVRVPNAYRVLLTRSREGMIVLCEEEATARRLAECGVVRPTQ